MKTFKQHYITEIADMNEKVLYIARGVPGSGKSYTIKQMVPKDNIFSTDDFWGPNYDFNPSKIGFAHTWNQKRANDAMSQGMTPVAIDNTNLTWKEIKPYAKMAKANGYRIEYVESESPWWQEVSRNFGNPGFKPGQGTFDKAVKTFFKKNTHGVPIEVIARMLMKWTPTNQLPR